MDTAVRIKTQDDTWDSTSMWWKRSQCQKSHGEGKVLKCHCAKLDKVSRRHTGSIKHPLAIQKVIKKKTKHLVMGIHFKNEDGE